MSENIIGLNLNTIQTGLNPELNKNYLQNTEIISNEKSIFTAVNNPGSSFSTVTIMNEITGINGPATDPSILSGSISSIMAEVTNINGPFTDPPPVTPVIIPPVVTTPAATTSVATTSVATTPVATTLANQFQSVKTIPKQTSVANTISEKTPAVNTKSSQHKDKPEQAIDILESYLQQTKNTTLLSALGNANLEIGVKNLKDNILGRFEGNSIFINSDIIEESTSEELASIYLHELNHFAKRIGDPNFQNSKQEETECKIIEEEMLDFFGQGEENDATQNTDIARKVDDIYSDLPDTP